MIGKTISHYKILERLGEDRIRITGKFRNIFSNAIKRR